MKYIYILFLILVAFSTNSPTSKEGRDLIKGLMTTIKGSQWKLDDKCLGSEFDSNFKQLYDAIKSDNTITVMLLAKKIAEDVKSHCPYDDMNKILIDTIVLYENGGLNKNIINHVNDIIRLVKEEINSELTPFNIGKFAGKFINIVVYNLSHNFLNFLELPLIDLNEKYEQILDGFFAGISSVPIEKNKCVADLIKAKSKFVDIFDTIYDSIYENSDLFESFAKVYSFIQEMKKFNPSCKINELSNTLNSITGTFGITRLLADVVMNIVPIYDNTRKMYETYKSGDFKKSGKHFGKLIKIIFKYSTE